jgi:hypothetical protein
MYSDAKFFAQNIDLVCRYRRELFWLPITGLHGIPILGRLVPNARAR